jgi:hypothetical protein
VLAGAVAALIVAAFGPQELREAVNGRSSRREAQARMAPATRFSLGATEEDVRVVQGTPDTIRGNTWIYGNSRVYFRLGRVVGWSSA